MSQFTIHTTESAPEGSRESLTALSKRIGFVPNMMATLAESPAALKGYLALQGMMEQTTLTATEKQVVMLTASFENECTYCMAAHTTFAQHQKVDAQVLAALREGRELTDPRLEALRQFTMALVRQRGWVEEDQIAALLAAGITRAQVFEILMAVSLKTFSNYVNHVAETEVDAGFAANRWSKPVSA